MIRAKRYVYLVLYGCDKSEHSPGFGAMQLDMSKKVHSLPKKFMKELISKIEEKQKVTGVKIDSIKLLREENVSND